VKPVHHLADIRSRFQVFKHERNRRPGVPGFSENTLLRYRAGAGRSQNGAAKTRPGIRQPVTDRRSPTAS
jgi:hypothetical protein